MPINVALADDHPIVLQGLRQLFEREHDFHVVATCVSGEEALGAVRAATVDVLVLDLLMPGLKGLDVLRRMRDDNLRIATVLLTASIDDDEVVEAVQLGARGIVLKDAPPSTLLECVRRVHAGHRWLDHPTLDRAFDRVLHREASARDAAALLTPREAEIVRMVAEGLRNRDIATRLAISEGTVKIHLHNIYEKLGVDGRLALAVFAREKGLI
jgi:two-component system nitrate/nitrite response regulator NarL